MKPTASLENLWQDLRYGARLLWHSPAFAIVAIASLALGIGANTAIFQLLEAVQLRSLPVKNPGELVEVRIAGGNHGMGINAGPYSQLTRPLLEQIREEQEALSGVFAWSISNSTVGRGSTLRQTHGLWVTGDFFRVLGVQPWRGRLLEPEDEGACPVSVAVVSFPYWQREMGGQELSPDTKLLINGAQRQIVGVTPPEFFGLAVGEGFDLALPFCQPKEALRRDAFMLSVMGRLRPGWTVERASAQLDAISPALFEATALTGYSAHTIETYKQFRLAAYPVSAGVSELRDRYDSSLWLLLGITGLVLLIACANLANLMLARASSREREVSIRLALGASRGRLLRQFLTESALLALLGAGSGIGVAGVLSRLLVSSLSDESSTGNVPIGTNGKVLLFAVGIGALTLIVFGAAPALRVTGIRAIKVAGRGLTQGRDRFFLQRLMVVTQIAVSLVLLAGAFLFVRSFRNLMTFDPGMRESGITSAFIGFNDSHVPHERNEAFKRELVDEVRSVPGVLDAATTTMMPLLGGSWTHAIHVGTAEGSSKFTWVSPGYFRTMGIPLLSGRDFTDNDSASSGRVAVVNKTFVSRLLGGADPIGMTMRTEAEPNYPATVYEIVGVIPDTKYNDIRGESPPMVFAPASQCPAAGPWTAMLIHSSTTPATTIASVRALFAEKHPEIAIELDDFQAQIRSGLVRERLMAVLSGFFGVLAALLATVGLYGVISYIAAMRQKEIGIRMALGAQRSQVVGLVMRQASLMLITGVVIGLGLALLAGSSASSLLFGLKPYDPLTLGGAVLLLTVIAACASFVPARRAAGLDPMIALRHE